MYFLSVQILS